MRKLLLGLSVLLFTASSAPVPTFAQRGAAANLQVTQTDITLKDFKFKNGQTLPELKIHVRTIGTLKQDASGKTTNAILILHGTTGTGAQFITNSFSGQLFNEGQPLDAAKYFLIMPDDIGHGQSSKPSDGLKAKFPNYGYTDMLEAEYRMCTEGLKVNHFRLVMGTSMGGMRTWQWGEEHPDMMDALMPLASLPEQIAGRNREWRQMISDLIRRDPAWKNGDYTAQPDSLRTVAGLMMFMGENPVLHYNSAPTGDAAMKKIESYEDNFMRTYDANNVLYAYESSRDYDPEPKLELITAPLLAVNSQDDLINPPDLQILEKQIKRVKNGKAINIPESAATRGHGSHTIANLWKADLVELLQRSEPKQ